jgi:hypothetical protein
LSSFGPDVVGLRQLVALVDEAAGVGEVMGSSIPYSTVKVCSPSMNRVPPWCRSLDDFVATPGIEEFRDEHAGRKIKDGDNLCSMACLGGTSSRVVDHSNFEVG